MLYTEEVKRKLEAILKAFQDFIDGQDYFDIVFSKKIGYTWIIVNPPGGAAPEQLNTPEKMLDTLFHEVVNDTIIAPENPTRAHDTSALTEWEEAESRRRLTVILETIEGDSAEYLRCMEDFFIDYKERYR